MSLRFEAQPDIDYLPLATDYLTRPLEFFSVATNINRHNSAARKLIASEIYDCYAPLNYRIRKRKKAYASSELHPPRVFNDRIFEVPQLEQLDISAIVDDSFTIGMGFGLYRRDKLNINFLNDLPVYRSYYYFKFNRDHDGTLNMEGSTLYQAGMPGLAERDGEPSLWHDLIAVEVHPLEPHAHEHFKILYRKFCYGYMHTADRSQELVALYEYLPGKINTMISNLADYEMWSFKLETELFHPLVRDLFRHLPNQEALWSTFQDMDQADALDLRIFYGVKNFRDFVNKYADRDTRVPKSFYSLFARLWMGHIWYQEPDYGDDISHNALMMGQIEFANLSNFESFRTDPIGEKYLTLFKRGLDLYEFFSLTNPWGDDIVYFFIVATLVDPSFLELLGDIGLSKQKVIRYLDENLQYFCADYLGTRSKIVDCGHLWSKLRPEFRERLDRRNAVNLDALHDHLTHLEQLQKHAPKPVINPDYMYFDGEAKQIPDSALVIVLPQSSLDVREWGQAQKHCLGSYADRAADENGSLILGVQDAETGEWLGHMMWARTGIGDSCRNPAKYSLSQFRGKQNATIPEDQRKKVVDYVNRVIENMNKKNAEVKERS